MRRLLDYFKSYFQFYRFDLEQRSSSTITSNDNHCQLYLDCFSEICLHLDEKISLWLRISFTKKVYIQPYEAKRRKTSGYVSVTDFNIIDIECHRSAIKQARSRDAWKSALLKNPNT
ncbi:unnamed protein product [Rotaria sordida]|uniref:E3 ubiquitin ligase UBR4 C-terminal domain-containing protein n=1 Tax=Rotaria sordida TaxID=392033 RepID=A0A815JR14_9BILA|nr:unnamed protein product [Rotaria sordida]CAF4004260.1 unnamed protein product [Rotaria sordida]